MANAANITLVGNLGRDPETRFTPNGAMNVGFTMAVNRRRGQEEIVNWYRVTAWGKLAEVINDLSQQGALTKGSPVYVAGRLTVREYKDREGRDRYSLDVDSTEIQLLGGRADGEQGAYGSGGDRDFDDIPF